MTSAGTITGPIKIVGPEEARHLSTTFDSTRRAYRQNGAVLPPQLRTLFAEIEAVAAHYSPQPALPTSAAPIEWIDTTAAAAILQLSERRVRALGDRLQRRKRLGNWEFSRADVIAEAAARAPAE